MTNGEKYLKDETTIDKFIDDYLNFSISRTWERGENSFENITKKFFKAQSTPTLTEDERVILRNIQKGLLREGFIARTTGNELNVFIKETGEVIELYIFNHLFQFIKERRRIFHRRIT